MRLLRMLSWVPPRSLIRLEIPVEKPRCGAGW
jgi:hypothetical protein